MRKLLIAALLLIPLAACSSTGTSRSAPSFTLGWYPGESSTFTAPELATLTAAGGKPQVVNYYSGWYESFRATMVQAAHADGVTLFAEIEPWNVSLTDIAAGKYDSYLIQWGQQVKAAGVPIWVTFAHEMNGSWYPWGYGHASPWTWIAAWNRVTKIINAQTSLVTWVWAPNIGSHITDYWKYNGLQMMRANIVGLDGYLCLTATSGVCTQTYANTIAPFVKQVRTVTQLPVMLTETGIGGTQRGSELAAEVTAVHQAGLLGMLYFNANHWALTSGEEQSLAGAVKGA